MLLKYQEQLDSIENCPVNNEKGEKVLFRCVENPMTHKSFTPNAVLLKPKFKDNCLGWGLSLFSDYNCAKQMLNNLSKNKRVKYSAIAKSMLTDSDGIKHNSSNKYHYTFYPANETDILSKFKIVDENK